MIILILLGGSLGLLLSKRVKMTEMPELVAILDLDAILNSENTAKYEKERIIQLAKITQNIKAD